MLLLFVLHLIYELFSCRILEAQVALNRRLNYFLDVSNSNNIVDLVGESVAVVNRAIHRETDFRRRV